VDGISPSVPDSRPQSVGLVRVSCMQASETICTDRRDTDESRERERVPDLHCDTLCTSGFVIVDDVMLSRNSPVARDVYSADVCAKTC